MGGLGTREKLVIGTHPIEENKNEGEGGKER